MMGTYQIIVVGNAPELFIGSVVGGAKIVAIKDVSPKLVSAADLAEQYSLSVDVVRERCADINKGTKGKRLYDPNQAHILLTEKVVKRGRKRAV